MKPCLCICFRGLDTIAHGAYHLRKAATFFFVWISVQRNFAENLVKAVLLSVLNTPRKTQHTRKTAGRTSHHRQSNHDVPVLDASVDVSRRAPP